MTNCLILVFPNVTVFLFLLAVLREAHVLPEHDEEPNDSYAESSPSVEASGSAPFVGAATVALVSPLGVGLRQHDPRRGLSDVSHCAGDELLPRLDFLLFLFFL